MVERADGAAAELAGFARTVRGALPAVILGLVLAAALQAVAIVSALGSGARPAPERSSIRRGRES